MITVPAVADCDRRDVPDPHAGNAALHRPARGLKLGRHPVARRAVLDQRGGALDIELRDDGATAMTPGTSATSSSSLARMRDRDLRGGVVAVHVQCPAGRRIPRERRHHGHVAGVDEKLSSRVSTRDGSPTSPNVSRAVARAVSSPSSSPDIPTARTPAPTNAETSRLFTEPDSTICTMSRSSVVVTRRPPWNRRRHARAAAAAPTPHRRHRARRRFRSPARGDVHCAGEIRVVLRAATDLEDARHVGQPHRLVDAEDDVRVLHRLTRRALDQVVDRRTAPAASADARRRRAARRSARRSGARRRAASAARHRSRRTARRRSLRATAPAGLPARAVSGTVIVARIPRATGSRCGVKIRSASAPFASEHRAHLGQVPMRVPDAVCPEVLRHLAEQQIGPRTETRARDAARRVRDDGCARRNEAAPHQRQQAPSGSPWDSSRDWRRRSRPAAAARVTSVSPYGTGAAPFPGRRSDDRSTTRAPAPRTRSTHVRRRTVRQRGEHELGAGQRGVIVGDEPDVRAAEPRALASPLVRGGERELHAPGGGR